MTVRSWRSMFGTTEQVKFEPLGDVAQAASAQRRKQRTRALMLLFLLAAAAFIWRTQANGTPLRLLIRGQDIFVPGQAAPVTLRGVDLMFKFGARGMDRVLPQDRELKAKLPGVNLVRLIVNHWEDDVTTKAGNDCHDEAAPDFLRASCLAMFDEVVNWATGELQSWVILTARSALAAGDGGVGRTIFDNSTLHGHWVAMWGALARRYARTSRIAGFEVMSEPRTNETAEAVHAVQQAACVAIWTADAAAACVVGPARFYDRFALGSSYLIKGGPTIYAANFFAPRSWVGHGGSSLNASYPGDFPCCDAYQKDRESRRAMCGDGVDVNCSTAPLVRVDKQWLEGQLRAALTFREEHAVPLWIDQWGVRADAVGGVIAHQEYLRDILDVFAERRLHWTYWIWRRTYRPPDWTCDGYAIVCETPTGNYSLRQELLSHLSRAMAPPDQGGETRASSSPRDSSPVRRSVPHTHILLLEADQVRPDAHALAAQEGQLGAATPHLDSIAREGVRFARAYSSTPICTPARLALLTGRSPFRHGMRSYRSRVPPPMASRMELVQSLADRGYYTAAVDYGTVQSQTAGSPAFEAHGYMEMHLHEGLLEYDKRNASHSHSEFVRLDDYGYFFGNACQGCDPLAEGPAMVVRANGTLDEGSSGAAAGEASSAWRDVRGASPYTSTKGYVYPYAERLHPTAWTAETAIRVFEGWLARHKPPPEESSPLFLKVSFHRPHPPYDPPERWLRQILRQWDRISLPVAGSWGASFAASPGCTAARREYCGQTCGYQGFCGWMDDHHAKLVRAHYYASLSFVDEQAGRLLSRIRRSEDAWDHTFVLYLSDHGDALGDHGLWRKGWPYEQVATIPLYARWPSSLDARVNVARGSVLGYLVELRDVFPTLLAVAGVTDVPYAANSSTDPSVAAPDGRSLLPLLEGSDAAIGAWRKSLLLELAMCNFNGTNWAALTDGRQKYVRHLQDGQELLFDLTNDPYEVHNLAGVQQARLSAWRSRLNERFTREGRGSKWVLPDAFDHDSVTDCSDYEDLSVQPARPNMVLFLSDDQDLMLGGLTPMRQANALLAEEGAVFTNFFAHSPICGPSRAQLLTGRYFHNLKIDPTLPKPRPLGEDCMHVNTTKVTGSTFARPLRDAGYKVGLFGKYLNSPADWRRVPDGFEAWFANGGGDYLSPRFMAHNLEAHGVPDGYWQGTPADYSTSVIGNVSVAWIQAAASEPAPFFAYVAVKAPHEPFTPAPWHVDHWDSAWPTREPRPSNWNCSSAARRRHHGVIAKAPMMTAEAGGVITSAFKNRWRTLMSFDDLVGAAYEAVESAGALDRTYFLLTSDHGFQLGQFNILMDKRHVYDWDTRIPLIVRGPGISPGGWRVTQPATLVDLAPTFLDIAGISKPESMDGRSLLPLLVDETDRSAMAALLPATKALVRPNGARTRVEWRSAVLIAHYFFSENAKCVGDCTACEHCREQDSNCGDTLAGQQCWSTEGASWAQWPLNCSGVCYPTESTANNFVALRHVGGRGGAPRDTLYAEFKQGNLDAGAIDFTSPTHHEFFDVATDTWQVDNLYYEDDEGTVRATARAELFDELRSELRSWLSCAGDACP